jgi:hypothetical protein
MKQQTIKSLQAQIKNVTLDNFALTKLSRGDYGYNSAEGILDGKIEVVFKIPYMKDNDSEAAKTIADCFEVCKLTVEKILIPATRYSLKKYDGARLLLYSQIEYEIAGHTFTIYIEKCEPSKATHLPPRFFGFEEYISKMKAAVKKHIANFETILNTKDFRLESFGETEGSGSGSYYQITGTAYGVSNSFAILRKDFANVDMKRKLKDELKNFKRLSKQPNRPIGAMIDLRIYSELVDAQKMSEKLSNASYASKGKRHDAAFAKWTKYDDEVFARVIFDVLNKIKPKLIYWRTGESFSFNEIFCEDFDGLDNNDISCLQLLLDNKGPYIWAETVVLLNGEISSQRSKELLELGQKPQHNLNNAYMYIRDDDIVLNEKNEIAYNHNNGAATEAHKTNRRNMTIKYIKEAEHRLTYNYKVFVAPQDQYKANSLIAIFAAFNGNHEKAKTYKAKAEKIKNITRDPKLDKLLEGIETV